MQGVINHTYKCRNCDTVRQHFGNTRPTRSSCCDASIALLGKSFHSPKALIKIGSITIKMFNGFGIIDNDKHPLNNILACIKNAAKLHKVEIVKW